ncbi:DUF805 domain-containing protein [Nannocystis pusilla]|uniref:SRPBCC family protein n=1 Tax=Nannocystis pusilla TaxID=889268 RepID=A0ABS7TXR1_9BACT|nr:SRPBCC family protein [Nannocystis pusilla]
MRRSDDPGLLRFLFGMTAPVGRRSYLVTGVALMALKYAIDAGLIYATTGHVWTPVEFLSPLLSTREAVLRGGNQWALLVMLAASLPFTWIGLAMTVRRAEDAGESPVLALLFLVPGVNFALLLAFSLWPTAPRSETAVPATQAPVGVVAPHEGIRAALLGVALGLVLAVGITLFSTLVLREYGYTLFFITPTLVAACAGYVYNRTRERGTGATIGVGLLALLMVGGALLLLAIEGALCLLMAAPLAAPLGILGAMIGQALAGSARVGAGSIAALVLALPILTAVEAWLPAPLVEREVRTTIVVDAPPAAVWPNVVGFVELDAPPAWIYELGVAYPLRARIEGEGVGAVRHCEFTTGAFVEPITAWEPGRRLAFDVVAQPAPMHELSPYRHVHPPHLDGYFRSRRGEFRLRDLGDGRTELSGSTWYTLDLAPTTYWALWTDALIHGIHRRALAHVARLSERGAVSVPAAVDDVAGVSLGASPRGE